MKPPHQGNEVPVKVECYAGYKGDQEPRKFLLGDRWLEVEEILKRWREPAAVFFQVRAEDGRIYVLAHGESPDHEWTLGLGISKG